MGNSVSRNVLYNNEEEVCILGKTIYTFQVLRINQDVWFGFICEHPQYITLLKTVIQKTTMM